jgi:transposase
MYHIGLDAHSATFTIAVLNQKGKLVLNRRMPTSEENLIEQVNSLVGPLRLVVEECPLAQWVKTVLEPYVEELVVCDPRRNRWIAEEEFNDDRTSAVKLAQLMRGGYIKPIVHPGHEAYQLRRLFYHYFDLTGQVCRFKNKLKATFRLVGRRPVGGGVYTEQEREDWLRLLAGHGGLLHQARQLYRVIDLLEELKGKSLERSVGLARSIDADSYELLNTVPGVGPVIGSGYMAIIVRPERFSRENKLWRYAGLGNARRISDGVVSKESPSKSGNRVLKWLVREHFQGAVLRAKGFGRSNRFNRHYAKLLADGQSQQVARRSVSRKLLSVVRAIWIKGEPYRDD